MSLIGKKAPVFSAPAVIDGSTLDESFSLEQYLGKKEVVLFFFPKSFTGLCPTEIIAFQDQLAAFEQRGVQVVGCSTDTEDVLKAWLDTPRDKGGIAGVQYPLVADVAKTIAYNFGVLSGDWDYDENDQLAFNGAGVAFRATFLIDKDGTVQHETVNNLPLTRNINETLRTVDAWQYLLKHGEACPANWTPED